MTVRWTWLLGLCAACATGFTAVIPVEDRDGDGVPDAEDVCPDDPTDDADGDGVCGADDLCAEGDDAVDDDEDGVPDACDPCPGDPDNDADGDGRCAAVDTCPDDADDDCDVNLILGIQVDMFPAEATWELVDYRGGKLLEGGFNDATEGRYFRFAAPAGRKTCVVVSDGGEDGGTRGVVFSKALERRFVSWTFGDYERTGQFCFTPNTSEPQRYEPLDEAAWLALGACNVELLVRPGSGFAEIGWQLSAPGPRAVRRVEVGEYTSADEDRRTLRLAADRYGLTTYDSGGDGWEGGKWFLGYPGQGAPFAEGTLVSGSQGTEQIDVDCKK